jgi:RimJ/RimL family protein N-acetyltransferase
MTDRAVVLEVPDLAGGGWRLRSWRPDDAAALAAAWDDPDVLAGSAPPPGSGADDARRWIEGCDRRRRDGLALDLAVVDAADAVVGEVGLGRFDPDRRAAMIGWWVARPARRRGVATTAVGLVADWALAPGRLDALLAEIAAANTASRRVAGAAGFTEARPASAGEPSVWVRRRG